MRAHSHGAKWLGLAVLSLIVLATPSAAAPARRAARIAGSGWEREHGWAYVPGERAPFAAFGFGWFGSSDMFLGSGFSVAGGVELPVNSWTVVPRGSLDVASRSGSSGLLVRGMLDGRISTLFSSRRTYFEAGVGLAWYQSDHTEPAGVPAGPARTTSTRGWAPAWQVLSGVTSDPEVKPGFLAELELNGTYRDVAMTGVVGRVGILF